MTCPPLSSHDRQEPSSASSGFAHIKGRRIMLSNDRNPTSQAGFIETFLYGEAAVKFAHARDSEYSPGTLCGMRIGVGSRQKDEHVLRSGPYGPQRDAASPSG